MTGCQDRMAAANTACYTHRVAGVAVLRGSLVAGRYRVLERIGRGGMGAVYEAIDTVTDRVRALKLVDGAVDDDARMRFRAEALIAGRVASEHVVDVTDGGYDADLDVLYLVMERILGEDLGAIVGRGALVPEAALPLLAQVAEGLAALHDEGIVHRDLKPENVVLATGPRGTLVKIIDLGLAKRFVSDSTLPKTTRAVGTPVYMAPEQLRGDGALDHRADVYAFAQLAFVVLTGAPYYADEIRSSENLYSLLLRVAEGARTPASSRAATRDIVLPPAFDAWFATATHPDPRARFDSMRSTFDALQQVFPFCARFSLRFAPVRVEDATHATQSSFARAASPAPKRSERARRARRVLLGSLAAALGATATLGAALLAPAHVVADSTPRGALRIAYAREEARLGLAEPEPALAAVEKSAPRAYVPAVSKSASTSTTKTEAKKHDPLDAM